MITVQGLGKAYGKKENRVVALVGGASLAIVGKSRSGKSTLMHVMSGLDRVTTESVTVDGRELAGLKREEMDRFRAHRMGFILGGLLGILAGLALGSAVNPIISRSLDLGLVTNSSSSSPSNAPSSWPP